MSETVYIDGAMGEGGGQIVRTSVALAAITGKTVEIANIRAKRAKPGLAAQHLTSVRAAGVLCGAEMHGAELESRFLRFVPGAGVAAGEYAFDVAAARGGKSAGAAALVLQTVAMPLALAGNGDDSKVTAGGGTHVPMSPTADYLRFVFLPAVEKMGVESRFEIRRAGFFPVGGGELALTLSSPPALGLDITERGKLKRLIFVVTTGGLPDTVATRGAATLWQELKGYGLKREEVIERPPSDSPGAAVLIVAECEHITTGFSSLGERGKPMETVARDAVRDFQRWFASGLAADQHLADQLVLPAALAAAFAGAETRYTAESVTDHLTTVLEVTQRFLPVVTSIDGQTVEIRPAARF